jgi:hypothetical protein
MGNKKGNKSKRKPKDSGFALFALFAFFAVPSPDGLNALVFKSALTSGSSPHFFDSDNPIEFWQIVLPIPCGVPAE